MKSFYIASYQNIITSFVSLEEDIRLISSTPSDRSQNLTLALWQKDFRDYVNPRWLDLPCDSTLNGKDSNTVSNDTLDTDEIDQLGMELKLIKTM